MGRWPAKVWFVCDVTDSVTSFLNGTFKTCLDRVGFSDRLVFPDGLKESASSAAFDVPFVVEHTLKWDRRARLKLTTACGCMHIYPSAVASFDKARARLLLLL